MRIAWRGFADWISEVHPHKKISLEKMLELVSDLHEDIQRQTYEDTLHNSMLQSTATLFNEYLDHLRNHNGALSSFWMSYVDMVGGLLLGLL